MKILCSTCMGKLISVEMLKQEAPVIFLPDIKHIGPGICTNCLTLVKSRCEVGRMEAK